MAGPRKKLTIEEQMKLSAKNLGNVMYVSEKAKEKQAGKSTEKDVKKSNNTTSAKNKTTTAGKQLFKEIEKRTEGKALIDTGYNKLLNREDYIINKAQSAFNKMSGPFNTDFSIETTPEGDVKFKSEADVKRFVDLQEANNDIDNYFKYVDVRRKTDDPYYAMGYDELTNELNILEKDCSNGKIGIEDYYKRKFEIDKKRIATAPPEVLEGMKKEYEQLRGEYRKINNKKEIADALEAEGTPDDGETPNAFLKRYGGLFSSVEGNYNALISKVNERLVYSMSSKEIEPRLKDKENPVAYTTTEGYNITWKELYDDAHLKEYEEKIKNSIDVKEYGKYEKKNVKYEISLFSYGQAIGDNPSGSTYSSIVTVDDEDAYLYNYINGDKEARDKGMLENVHLSGTLDDLKNKYLTEDEKKIFNALWKTQGAEKAKEYLKLLNPDLRSRRVEAEKEYYAQMAKDNAVGAWGASVALNLKNNAMALPLLAADYLEDSEIDKDSSLYTGRRAVNTIRSTQENMIDNKVGKFFYRHGTNAVDNVAAIAADGGTKLSILIMSSGAAIDTVIDAKERGLTDAQALGIGAIAGAAEWVFESRDFEALFNKKELTESAWKYFANNIKTELIGELSTEATNDIADYFIAQDLSKLNTEYKSLIASGLSDKEALNKVVRGVMSRYADVAAGTIFSTGVMAGVPATVQHFSDKKISDASLPNTQNSPKRGQSPNWGISNGEIKYSVGGSRYSNIDSGEDGGYNSNSEQFRAMWTLEDEILSKREVASFYTKISEMAKQKYSNYHMSNEGEYIFEIENKLVYTDGDYDYPEITRVVTFNTEDENLIDYGRRCVYESIEYGYQLGDALEISETLLGQGNAFATNFEDSGAFEREIRKGKRLNDRTFDSGSREDVAGHKYSAMGTRLSDERSISDSIAKDARLPNIVKTIGEIERRSSGYYNSQEAIDTARAVLKMANGTATQADYALIEKSEGARTVVLASEGTKAWQSLKVEAQSDSDARVDMKASKSGIDIKKSVREYPYDVKKVITDYVNSTNEDFKSFIKNVNEDKNTPQNKKYLFGNVAERTSKIIEKITGINVEGFKTAIESRMIWHIEKDHGINGKTDKSMSNIDDLARIEYVLNNYDDIVYGGTTKSYTTVKENGRTKLADTVVYSKKINGTYYVVQAVPNAKAKTLYVVSAYINKKGASQLTDADNAPVLTSKDGSVVTPTNSISEDDSTVNSKDMRDSEIYSNGKKVSFEKGERVGGNIVYNEASRKFAKKNREGYKLIQTMAKDLGMKVKFVVGLTDAEGNVLDGVITSEGIFINTESENPTRFAATHEFSHRMKQTGGKAWQRYQDYVIGHLKETGKYQAKYDAKKGFYAENEIDEEIAADYIGELFSDVKALSEFIRESRQTAFSIRNMWYRVLDALGLSDEKKKAQRMWASAYREAMKNKDAVYEGGKKFSIQRIVGENGDYGIGVYLDSDILTELSESERITAVKNHIKSLGGHDFVAYDNGEPVRIRIAKYSEKYVNKNGADIRVNNDLISYLKNKVKQEAIVLIDELTATATYDLSEKAKHPHGWLDDYGKNDWDYWRVFIQEKNKTVWEATLNIANSKNGEKILYDIYPIKMMEGAGTSATTTTNTNVPQNESGVKGKKSVAGTRVDDGNRQVYDAETDQFTVDEKVVKAFGEKIDAWLQGEVKSDEYFDLGETPVVLRELGADNLPVVYGKSVMWKMTGGKHGIAIDEIKELPKVINNPLMVFKSSTVDNAFVIITELSDKAGDPVIAAIHLNKLQKRLRINRFASAYGKENIENFLREECGKGNLKYVDKIKSQQWSTNRGLQLPKLVQSITDNNIILQKEDVVNKYSMQNGEKYEKKSVAGTRVVEKPSVSDAETSLYTREAMKNKDAVYEDGAKYGVQNGRLTEGDVTEYLKSGTRKNLSKRNAFSKGENIILHNEREITEFIHKAISNTEKLNTVGYGRVGERLAHDVDVYSNGKIKIDNNFLELVPYDVHHAYEEHIKAKESGDIDLSIEDFENIPSYIDNYDELVYAIRYKNGNTRICLSKRVENGRVLLIETVSKSRGSIAFKNMIGVSEEKYVNKYESIYKKRNSANPRGSNSSNISLRDATVSTNSISDSEKNVKKKSVAGTRVVEKPSVSDAETSLYTREAMKSKDSSDLQRDAFSGKIKTTNNLSESGEVNDSENTKALGADGTGQNNDSIWERSNDSEEVYRSVGGVQEISRNGKGNGWGFIPWSGRIQSYDLNSSREKERAYGILRKISERGIKGIDFLGRPISEQVQEYFADTVLKTEDGALIPLYHATDNEFDVFEYGDFGFHIGSAEQAMYLDKKYIKEVYVNIKNPLFINADTMTWPGLAIASHALSQGIITLNEFNSLYKMDGFMGKDYNSEANKGIRELLKKRGYDGIIYPNDFEGEGISAIAFDSEQIKYTSNQKPTINKNLKKSVAGTRVVESATSSEFAKANPPSPQGKGFEDALEVQKAKYTDRFSRDKLKSRIDSDFSYLHRMLADATDKRHIPEHLRPEVAAVLDCIKFETKQLDRIRDAGKEMQSPTAIKLANISGLYEDIIRKAWGVEKSGDSKLLDEYLSEDVLELKESIPVDESGNFKRLQDMSTEELRVISDVLRGIHHAVTKSNQAFTEGIKTTIGEASDNVVAEMASTRGKRRGSGQKLEYGKEKGLTKAIGAIDKFMNVDMLQPWDMFHRIGGTMEKIYGENRKAFDRHIVNLRTASEAIKTAIGELNVKKMTGKKAEVLTFDISDGRSVKVDKGQLLSLYALYRRPQGKEHILSGGIVTGRKATDGSGNKVSGNTIHKVTETDLGEMFEALSAEEKRMVEDIVRFMSKECARWGNEASMKLYGYEKYGEGWYFPIKVADTTLQMWSGSENEGNLRTQSFTKKLVKNAGNAVVINDFFDTVTGHINGMSLYNTIALPMLDMERVLNHKAEGETVRQAIDITYGKAVNRYINKWLEDVNGSKKITDDGGLTEKFFKNAKKASIGLNMRVLFQQPTSITRALLFMNPIDLTSGAKALVHPAKTIKEMQKHVPIAYWKSLGFRDVGIGSSLKDAIIDNESLYDKAAMSGYGLADDVTWSLIYTAVKNEVKRKNPDIDVNSEEFRQKVVERFNYIVDRSQVVDSVFHRSQIMRNERDFVKSATMFMSEPIKQLNMYRTEIEDALKSGGTTKKLSKATAVYMFGSLVLALVQALPDAWREDDDKEIYDEKGKKIPFWEIYKKKFGEDFLDDINPLNGIPYAKDLISIIQGYSMDRVEYSGLVKTINAIKALENDKVPLPTRMWNVFKSGAPIFGFAPGNLARDLEGITKSIMRGFGDEYIDYTLTKTKWDVKNPSNKSKFMKHYERALGNGNAEDAQLILGDYLQSVFKDKNFENEHSKEVLEEVSELYGKTDSNSKLLFGLPEDSFSHDGKKTVISENEYDEYVKGYYDVLWKTAYDFVTSEEYQNLSVEDKVRSFGEIKEYSANAQRMESIDGYELEGWKAKVYSGETEFMDSVIERRNEREYQNNRDEYKDTFSYDASKYSPEELNVMEQVESDAAGYYSSIELGRDYNESTYRHIQVYDDYISDEMEIEEYAGHRAYAKKTVAMADGKPSMKSSELKEYLDSTDYSTAVKGALFEAIGNKGWKNPYTGGKIGDGVHFPKVED